MTQDIYKLICDLIDSQPDDISWELKKEFEGLFRTTVNLEKYPLVYPEYNNWVSKLIHRYLLQMYLKGYNHAKDNKSPIVKIKERQGYGEDEYYL